jgi:hypothetical protein
MSSAMAARWAFVCALIASSWGATVGADGRRPVAVVNLDLTGDPAAEQLATKLSTALADNPELQPLQDTTSLVALKDRIADPDGAGLAQATQFKAAAENLLVTFDYPLALTRADDGESALLSVTPAAAQPLFADLEFIRGQAWLAVGKPDEAAAAFALCATLDPARTLDAARYLPEIVDAFAKAKAAKPQPGSISILGHGRAWIDAQERGQAEGGFAVPAGRHVVWLTGDERNDVGGRIAVVAPGKPTEVKIDDSAVRPDTKIRRARIALARTADATARAAAMTNLAKLTGVADAILIQVSGGKVIVQTWRAGNVDRSPGFSALREYTKDKDKVPDLLTPLAPPKKVVPIEPPFVPPPIVVAKWYQRRPVQVGILAGVVAAVVGGYLLSTLGADTTHLNPDFGVVTPTSGRN